MVDHACNEGTVHLAEQNNSKEAMKFSKDSFNEGVLVAYCQNQI